MEAGVTVTGLEVPKPPLHEYVVAPLAVRVVELPAQMGFADAAIETVGKKLVTVNMLGALNPQPLNAVTVIFPEIPPGVEITIKVSPCPEVMVIPGGTVHV